jgi:L-amino acid N-acyltransferase YncA
MDKITFRKANVADILDIYGIMKKVGYIDWVYGSEQSPAQIQDDIKNKFKLPERHVIVCVLAEKIIGYSIFASARLYAPEHWTVKLNPDYAYSKGIGIDPAFQGKGYGEALKGATVQFAKRAGFKGMYTDVSSKNAKSLNLQIKTGFKKITEFADERRKDGSKTVLFVIDF